MNDLHQELISALNADGIEGMKTLWGNTDSMAQTVFGMTTMPKLTKSLIPINMEAAAFCFQQLNASNKYLVLSACVSAGSEEDTWIAMRQFFQRHAHSFFLRMHDHELLKKTIDVGDVGLLQQSLQQLNKTHDLEDVAVQSLQSLLHRVGRSQCNSIESWNVLEQHLGEQISQNSLLLAQQCLTNGYLTVFDALMTKYYTPAWKHSISTTLGYCLTDGWDTTALHLIECWPKHIDFGVLKTYSQSRAENTPEAKPLHDLICAHHERQHIQASLEDQQLHAATHKTTRLKM